MSVGRNGSSAREEGLGGIYIDVAHGGTIAQGADGTRQHPVSTIAEAVTLAAAANTRVLCLAYTEDGIALTANLQGYYVYGYAYDVDIGVSLNFAGFDVSGSVFRNILVTGIVSVGTSAQFIDCDLSCIFDDGGAVLVHHCRFYNVRLDTSVYLYAYDCFSDHLIWGVIQQDDAGSTFTLINFNGFLSVRKITGSDHEIYGNVATLEIKNTCTGGTLMVQGNVKMLDASAGTAIEDRTGVLRPEASVNITAIVASETNVFDLSTADLHYIVESLWLNIADPGANTVNVRLYQLINGAPANVRTAAIVTPGGYNNLMDLFGIPHLAGDDIRVTVQATAGGPYAVTGSYSYRSV